MKAIEALSKLNDAAILPQLLVQNPQVTGQALGQLVCNTGGFLPFIAYVAQGVLNDLPGIGLVLPELGLPSWLLELARDFVTILQIAQQSQQKRPPRGAFIVGTNNIILLGRTIMDGTTTSLADAVSIVDLWMGDPPWVAEPSQPDILYSDGFSIDDGLHHRYRQRESDVNAARPHFNLEAGSFISIPGKTRDRFNIAGNLHLYFIV